MNCSMYVIIFFCLFGYDFVFVWYYILWSSILCVVNLFVVLEGIKLKKEYYEKKF